VAEDEKKVVVDSKTMVMGRKEVMDREKVVMAPTVGEKAM
jgi:hypothetical protein